MKRFFLAASFSLTIAQFTFIVSGGDTLVAGVIDPHTGLEWSDPIATVGLSYNSVTSLLGTSPYLGYRYATRLELNTFFSDFPDPLPTSPTFDFASVPDSHPILNAEYNYFTPTFLEFGRFGTVGLTGDPSPTGGHFQMYAEGSFDPSSQLSATSGSLSVPDIATNTFRGSWLVRVAESPEPSSIALAAFGFVGLCAWRWRRLSPASAVGSVYS